MADQRVQQISVAGALAAVLVGALAAGVATAYVRLSTHRPPQAEQRILRSNQTAVPDPPVPVPASGLTPRTPAPSATRPAHPAGPRARDAPPTPTKTASRTTTAGRRTTEPEPGTSAAPPSDPTGPSRTSDPPPEDDGPFPPILRP